MTTRPFDAEQFVRDYKSGTAKLTAAYGYDPAQEIDACGVGLVCAMDGKPRREVVELAIEALKAVWHRGAVDADGKTGDGAGMHVERAAGLLRRPGGAHRPQAAPGPHRRGPDLPAAHRPRRAGSVRGPSSKPRCCASASTSTAGARCRSTPR